ncbi:CFAP47 [Symbiodinium sp. CCMP2456]|nr:CFAP47 [Symbiodinium sp. CCMP2456]
MQDLRWGAQNKQGQPLGPGCDICMKVVVALLPDRPFPDVAEAVKKGEAKHASKADSMFREMVLSARARFCEQQEEGSRPLFSPGSSVFNKTGFGYRIYWEYLLCTKKQLEELSGKPVSSLAVTAVSFKLDGDTNSKLYAISMQGISEDQMKGMKRMQVFHELEVEHEESFLSPEHQLHVQQGENNFQFYTKQHFATRPGVAKVGSHPPTLSKLIENAEMQEAKNAAVAVPGPKRAREEQKGSGSAESSSSSSSNEDKGKSGANRTDQARSAPAPSLGSLQIAEPKKETRRPKAAATPRSPSPETGEKAVSISESKPRSLNLGGSKKEKEHAAVLEELERLDTEMLTVAKEHLRNKGSSVSCLKQLNVKHFLTNAKQGQASKIEDKLKEYNSVGAANLLSARRAVCEAASILAEGDLAAMKIDTLRKALVQLQDHMDDMPVSVLIKVTQKVLTHKLSNLVILREEKDDFADEACDFVTALLPVSPTATMFDLQSPTFHGLMAKVLDKGDFMEVLADDAGSSDDEEAIQKRAQDNESRKEQAALALQEPRQLAFCDHSDIVLVLLLTTSILACVRNLLWASSGDERWLLFAYAQWEKFAYFHGEARSVLPQWCPHLAPLICEETGKSILDIVNSNGMHELLNFAAIAGDAKCPSANAIRCLATTFLESHAALQGKLDQMAKERCLSHLLSAPDVGTPTTAAEVLYFSSYQGKATFERGVKITLTKKDKVADTEEEIAGFWQRQIDEAIRTAASTVQLRPLFDQVNAKLQDDKLLDDQAGASWLVESLGKLKSGMRAADLESLLHEAQELLVSKAEAIVEEANAADASAAVVQALQNGLQLFENEPGMLDNMQALQRWMSENIHEISAGRFAALAQKVVDTKQLDVDALASALKKCKRGKMTAESSGIVESFSATCYNVLLGEVVNKTSTQQHVSKILTIVDKALGLHCPETSLEKQFAVAASALLKGAKETVDALDQLEKIAATPEARLRKDKDMKLMQLVTTCISDLLEKQRDMSHFLREREGDMLQHPTLHNIDWTPFAGIDENETYQACLLLKMQAVIKEIDSKAANCLMLCNGYERGGKQAWTANFTDETTSAELVSGTDRTLKTLPSKAMSAACETLDEELTNASKFVDTFGKLVRPGEAAAALAKLEEKILEHTGSLSATWALYCEVILLACLVATNRERQKASVLKISAHLVSRKYGVDEDKLFQPLVAFTKINESYAGAMRMRLSSEVCCFDTDLEDSIVLAVVIQSHVPHCQAVQNMRAQCTSLDHHEENAMHIIAALSEIGLAFPIQVSDIASPQAKDMLLFAMFLFQNLPNYVPKTTIVFSTMLGVNMTKNIELTNPSKKAITYLVQLVGSSGNDFAVKEDTIKLEPRQTFSYPVEYCSRFSRLVEDKIMFTSKREGNVHAAAMVFKLRSRCTGRKPRKTINVSAVLYEVGTVDVELENPFSEDAEFTVALRESTVCDAEKNPVPSKRCEGMEAFYLSSTRCRVKAGATGKLTVSFLPFEAPAHFTALLGVFDSKAGEYYYELMGTSSPPLPLETYKMQVKAEASGTKDIILPLRNMQVERARTWLQNRGAGPPNPPDYINYDVKVSSPYYNAPKQVSIYNGNAAGGKGEGKGRGPAADRSQGGDGRRPSAQASQVAKLVVEFWPKEPGVYPCTVTLTSDVDIRIYQFEGTGTAPNTHCSLTFTTQARKPITQEIPIVNPTDREWAIKPTFSQIGHEFDGPREFFAKKKGATGQATVTTYPLTFKPEWVCDVKAQLVLYNVGTNETYEYDLHGIAEEPLAEEHVVVKCEAREKTSHVFSVKNHSNMTATLEVESDLVHISGPSSIQVDGRGTGEYELVFQPLQAGQVTGCIMFRDTHTGHFTWYTVELMTLPPKPQQQLTLTCVVRQAVAVDIQLVNPLDDVVVFEVALNGDGLLGEAEFVLAPKETATYELVFSPLLPARTKGTAVFFNEVVGEFWYDLSLIAEAALPEEIPLMQCELGRTAQTTVKVDNPTGQEVALKHRSTNKINFKVMNNRIILPPLESTEITIEYSPASLGVTEEAQIVFEHPSIGSWVYKAQGLGLPPLEARSVTVAAQVNRTVSSTIQFKNPFLETITIFIVLESKSEKGVFNLLSKKAKVQIGPLATTQIPFSFCPPTMTQHTAEIALSVMKPNLTWSYRVQGVAEAPADPTLHTFTVQARESLQTTYALTLIGLDTTPGDRHGDQLSCQLEVPPQHQAMVSKCFDISLDSEAPVRTASSQASKARSARTADGQVMLKVAFSPLRPFVALCNLVITRASGGRWRFDLKLEATEPEVDDIISIQSPLNKPASVAFRLNNHTSVYSEFEAFFDAESAYEFTVQPTAGVLEPAGTSGTTFVVTYKPTEYGKPVQGKLIIQTEDVFWSYLVKGTHPKYSAPVVDKPKVATRLTREMEAQLQKASQSRRKNFIKENMRGGGPRE